MSQSGIRASVVHVPANRLKVQVTERTRPGFQGWTPAEHRPLCVFTLCLVFTFQDFHHSLKQILLLNDVVVCLVGFFFFFSLSQIFFLFFFLTPANPQQIICQKKQQPGLRRSTNPDWPGKHQGFSEWKPSPGLQECRPCSVSLKY